MNMPSKPKQVIVIRRDLHMRRGKEIAQGSHASMAWLSKRVQLGYGIESMSEPERLWLTGSFAKVCLQVSSEQELLDIKQKAEDAGLQVDLITDSGLTEFGGVPTNTCLAIGPDFPEKIDPITGGLKLY